MGWDPWEDIKKAASNASNSVNSGLSEFGNNVNREFSAFANGANYNISDVGHTVSGWLGDLGGPSKPAAKAPAVQMPQPPQNSQSQVSSYPAYPNSFGLGGAMQDYTPQAPAAPQLAGAPQKQTSNISNNSQGFNPWSLTGEANSR